MRTLLGLVLTFALVANVSAIDIERSGKETELATTYLKCAAYADVSSLDEDRGQAIPQEDTTKFRRLGLKHWRLSNKMLESNENGDDEIISFATFLSSIEALLWEQHPELNVIKHDGKNLGSAAYYNANCNLLLQSAQ
ncbi:hypothetical protein ZH93_18200 [Salmonella enterica subsp. enterica serovar Corvallis]|nr:hypothetical protein [Salmonella enterica subsp. enterica serovar Corvallis]EEA6674071.1 hypothetical protein [Salmonella enterica subsp. enterica serovar Corvallis]HCB4671683.1 hypothetical protein [Enterobacter cloacae]